jgi:hypothetical protein
MIKYIFICVLLLSACTRQVTIPTDPQRELSEQEEQSLSMNTSMLLSNMDINEESIFTGGAWVSGNPVYTGAYNLLSQAESRCVGSDFEEFRICLIE